MHSGQSFCLLCSQVKGVVQRLVKHPKAIQVLLFNYIIVTLYMSILCRTSIFLTKWHRLVKSFKQVERIDERTTRLETKTQKKLFNIYIFIGLIIRIAKRTPIVFASARTPANHDIAPVKLLK